MKKNTWNQRKRNLLIKFMKSKNRKKKKRKQKC